MTNMKPETTNYNKQIMTLYFWFVFFLIVQLIHFLGTWKMYESAGRKSWEAAIPVYNSIVLMKIIGRPTWWTVLLFIPVINLIMFPVVWTETLRSFGKRSTLDTFLGIITLGFYIYYVNYTQKLEYVKDRSLVPHNTTADTISSLLFAIVVATLVHTYVIQPFTIPSASLEKTLLIGDFLFVSKMNYGARVPMTEVALPMVHDSIPMTQKLSYLSWPQLPYFRFPGFEKIKNNDIVVFNWPRDTLDNMYHPSPIRVEKPRDKKTNYVKRCVGIPGDSLQIKDGIVFINGKELILPQRAKPQYYHKVYSKKGISTELLRQIGSTEFNKTYEAQFDNENQVNALKPYLTSYPEKVGTENKFRFTTPNLEIPARVLAENNLNIQEVYDYSLETNLTLKGAAELRKNSSIDSVIRIIRKGPEDGVFPDYKDEKLSVTNNWSCDNFGPIYIPQAEKTVALDKKSLPLYKIIITEYEGNTLKVVGNDIYVNDKKATTYTFKQNYYWMMGDNRHNSLDARYFGYTPEDHVVGKPIFLWMSWDSNGKGLGKIRWERLFTTVSGEGEPQSYFKYFLILLVAYFVGEYFWKKRKANKV
jgi:signal peptidase I